jgi:AraC family transcriptional regulator, regulatory protein of adaptative response / DNA-3-methyladenine glycosylase II
MIVTSPVQHMPFTDDQCYSAMLAREHRFDGEFYVAVKTTGIYCRPSCPTPVHPKRVNVSFHKSSASAQQAGYRACKRCRPDSSVGSPARLRNDDVAGRALRLIEDGHVDRCGVTGLAADLHLSERQLNRVLLAELGAGPLALARARRAHVARTLIETTSVSLGDVAFAAGFASIRQFNETIQAVFASSPTELRTQRTPAKDDAGSITVRLPFREPFDAAGLFGFFAARAVPGVEHGTENTYMRTLRLTNGPGVVRVQMNDKLELTASFWLTSLTDLSAALSRVRRLFDLDSDPSSVSEAMSTDDYLGPVWDRHAGRRAPGAVDGNELAVKAVLGQQVSVAAARTLATRLADRLGERFTIPGAPLGLLFPSSETLAAIDPTTIGIPMARANALVGMCAALHDGSVNLSIGVPRADAKSQLLALKGIGPWTASYIAMRALSDPDVLLDDDLGVIHGAKALGLPTDRKLLAEHGQRWAPWRSYATQLLWASLSPVSPQPKAQQP